MSLLFAATYPHRVQALVCSGGMARSTWAEDYPWASPVEALLESGAELVAPALGRGGDDRRRRAQPVRQSRGPRLLRAGWSAPAPVPGCSRRWFRCSSTSTCATSFRASTSRRSSSIASATASSTSATGAGWPSTCRTRGSSSCPATTTSCGTRTSSGRSARSRSSSPGPATRPSRERMLATVLFTDIVDSTRTAAELGDQRWRERAGGAPAGRARRALDASTAARSSRPGDGFLATFDGPGARDPLRPGDPRLLRTRWASRCAPASTPASAR